eukprot:2202371-Prorocentrum_lima.AAC.1
MRPGTPSSMRNRWRGIWRTYIQISVPFWETRTSQKRAGRCKKHPFPNQKYIKGNGNRNIR